MTVTIKKPKTELPINAELENNEIVEKYGSKIFEFVKFTKLTLEKNPESKIILIIQFNRLVVNNFNTRLIKFVSTALSALGIEFHACVGTMTQKNKSIREFKSGNVPILILSSDDSMSGLNLTEASHVVFFHPILLGGKGNHTDGDDFDAETKMALSIEKQAIARAWRIGQKKQVEVVRFLTRDTIEEELATRRGYDNGIIYNMAGDYVKVKRGYSCFDDDREE
jgi:hypothetical protein